MDSQRADGADGAGGADGADRAGGRRVAQATRDVRPQDVAIMPTDHCTLQTVRAMTISDANGRSSLFLGTLSTSLVALAFVGGLARTGAGLGQAFSIFGLVLLPSLAFLGLVTFARVLQSGL